MLTAGLVTVNETDIYFHSAAFRGGLPDVQVGDVMSTAPEAVTPETPIAEVMERLVARDYTALPVVDVARCVVGIISDTDMLNAGLTRLSISLHKVAGPDLMREYLARLHTEGGTVRDAMSAPALTVTPTTPLREAAHLMHVRRLKRLPVVDAEGRLVGILGRLDVLQSIATGYTRRTTPHTLHLPPQHRTVGAVMQRSVPTVAETAPLADVVGQLLASEVKRVVVVDAAGRPVGIITDTDLVARVDAAERPGMVTMLRSRWSEEAQRRVQRAYGQRAADIMTSPAITVQETNSVIAALSLTVERHVKRLPVVDADGRLVGMVSRPALFGAALDVADTEA